MNQEKKQPKKEGNRKDRELAEVTDAITPVSISLYRQYLDWFTQSELVRAQPNQLPVIEVKGKDSAITLPSENTTKAESMIKPVAAIHIPDTQMTQEIHDDSPQHLINLEDDDQEMTESVKESEHEQPPPLVKQENS